MNSHQVQCLAISKNSKFILSGSFETSIRIWNIEKMLPEGLFVGHNKPVTSIIFTKLKQDKFFFSASMDKTIRLWNIKTKNAEFILNGHTG